MNFYKMVNAMKDQPGRNQPIKTLDDEMIHEKDINLEKIIVECICPKCGVRHFLNFPWTGRGTPRKFCPACKV
jgi:hypothetical protein